LERRGKLLVFGEQAGAAVDLLRHFEQQIREGRVQFFAGNEFDGGANQRDVLRGKLRPKSMEPWSRIILLR
ncbi:MAG: hypothetical protein RIQ93_1696, partial [Verrucomicrobiota bacterium]